MLYRIRFPWGVNISAPSAEAAHLKAVKMMAENPEGFITGVEDASLAKRRSFLNRLFTGK